MSTTTRSRAKAAAPAAGEARGGTSDVDKPKPRKPPMGDLELGVTVLNLCYALYAVVASHAFLFGLLGPFERSLMDNLFLATSSYMWVSGMAYVWMLVVDGDKAQIIYIVHHAFALINTHIITKHDDDKGTIFYYACTMLLWETSNLFYAPSLLLSAARDRGLIHSTNGNFKAAKALCRRWLPIAFSFYRLVLGPIGAYGFYHDPAVRELLSYNVFCIVFGVWVMLIGMSAYWFVTMGCKCG